MPPPAHDPNVAIEYLGGVGVGGESHAPLPPCAARRKGIFRELLLFSGQRFLYLLWQVSEHGVAILIFHRELSQHMRPPLLDY